MNSNIAVSDTGASQPLSTVLSTKAFSPTKSNEADRILRRGDLARILGR
jgi:hypothetical protein